jgi:hypothetical protein
VTTGETFLGHALSVLDVVEANDPVLRWKFAWVVAFQDIAQHIQILGPDYWLAPVYCDNPLVEGSGLLICTSCGRELWSVGGKIPHHIVPDKRELRSE